MLKCLVAIPYDRDQFLTQCLHQVFQLPKANPDFEFSVGCWKSERRNLGGFQDHANARNAVIDKFLTPDLDYVFWVDVDIVKFPLDFPTTAHKANPFGITAPCIVADTMPWRFYDVGGFVGMDGHNWNHETWSKERGLEIEMLSVGCVKIMPADIFYQGARFAGNDGSTDLWPVMRFARNLGKKIICLTREIAYHAYLPDYGENWHVEAQSK